MSFWINRWPIFKVWVNNSTKNDRPKCHLKTALPSRGKKHLNITINPLSQVVSYIQITISALSPAGRMSGSRGPYISEPAGHAITFQSRWRSLSPGISAYTRYGLYTNDWETYCLAHNFTRRTLQQRLLYVMWRRQRIFLRYCDILERVPVTQTSANSHAHVRKR